MPVMNRGAQGNLLDMIAQEQALQEAEAGGDIPSRDEKRNNIKNAQEMLAMIREEEANKFKGPVVGGVQLDKVMPGEEYNDTPTSLQRSREIQERGGVSRMQEMSPVHRNDPYTMNQFLNKPPSPEAESGSSMQQLYNQMPQGIPKYPMQVIPPMATDDASMEYLQQFYAPPQEND